MLHVQANLVSVSGHLFNVGILSCATGTDFVLFWLTVSVFSLSCCLLSVVFVL